MTFYDLGLSARNGFVMDRLTIEADNIKEATLMAEESLPGMKVHTGWAVDSTRENTQDLEWWMATHIPGVLRTQDAGSEQEEGS